MKKVRFKIIWALMLCLLLIIGCGGGGGGDSQTVIAEPGITVTETSPDATVFNGVVVKNTAERQFKITSTGTRTLHVGTITISPTPSNFSISPGYDNCSGQALAVGASCTFIVRYEPTSQKNPESGTISISGDVPATVALSGFSYGLNVWINQVSVDCSVVGSEKVVFEVTVTDPNTPSTVFTQDNFEPALGVITQGGTPQTITLFENKNPDSVSTVLALDLSISLTSAIGGIRTAAEYLINNKIADNDEVAMVKFKNDIKIYPDLLVKNFTIISTPAGRSEFTDHTTGFIFDTATDPTSEGTAFNDAVWKAIERAKLGLKSTKAVIVLSDGSNQGTPIHLLSDVIAYANAAPKIPVFAIYYVDSAYEKDAKPAIMAQLAKDTGGQIFYAAVTNMDVIFDQIWAALTKKYRITYKPTSCTGLPLLRVEVGLDTLTGVDTETVVFP